MKLEKADVPIETLMSWIDSDELDLQPDFQRGEVWSEAKQQRLIDSLLRGWHIPPIHIMRVKDGGADEVLDGQQRLVAIWDFIKDGFRVDGLIEPDDPKIKHLNGLLYSELPPIAAKTLRKRSITVFTLTQYRAAEPAELFFRLNQPTALTAAEQRNAFVGPARAQIKHIVRLFAETGVDKSFVGFSNSRMAYDDVLARLSVATARRSILQKITAAELADHYRSGEPFPENAISIVRVAARVFSAAREEMSGPVRLNKATMFSWLWFVVGCIAKGHDVLSAGVLGSFMRTFEANRADHRIDFAWSSDDVERDDRASGMLRLLEVYTDRATARVADVSSVVARDIALWCHFDNFTAAQDLKFPRPHARARLREWATRLGSHRAGADELLEGIVEQRQWGELK